MVRIIERSTTQNKELFDKLFDKMGTKVYTSQEVLMSFARLLNMGVVNALLMHQIQIHCDQYPYTILSKN